jgi:hypothetical protein
MATLWIASVAQLLPLVAQEVSKQRSYGPPGMGLNDSWEATGVSKPNPDSCREIDPVLVVPVPRTARAEAIADLGSSSIVSLSPGDSSRFLQSPGGQAPHFGITAENLVNSEIDRLLKRKDIAVTQRTESWSRADQNRLDDLIKLSKSPGLSGLRPFLVRAIAKYESTGGFFVSLCQDVLWISHGSLGTSDTVSTRVPIVVFLDSRPGNAR